MVLRTKELAARGSISVQQVRNYEARGFIPPAERAANGYRCYGEHHAVALETVRVLIKGYQWQRAGAIMQSVHHDKVEHALALIDEFHAELADKRRQLEQTLAALRTLAASPLHVTVRRRTQPLRIGAAAQQVGVRVSAIHFWEQQGLLHPTRDHNNRYRLYDDYQMRRLRVVVLLREAGYDFEVIRVTLEELAAGNPEKAIAAVEQRRTELAQKSWVCLTGITMFQQYVSKYRAEEKISLITGTMTETDSVGEDFTSNNAKGW